MLKIKNTANTVPKGWKFTHPASGAVITGGDYGDLLKNIHAHGRGNGYPRLTEAEIQDSICRSLVPGATSCVSYDPGVDPASEPSRRRVHLNDAVRFIKTMGRLLGTDEAFVSQEETERRARICVACPMNQTIEGCTSCHGILNWVSRTIGDRRTLEDARLKGCAVCSCSNAVAVHMNLAAQQAEISDELNAEFVGDCWKKRR